MLPMQPVSCPQPSCLRALHPLPQQALQAPLHLAHPARVPLGAQLGAAVPQMNRFPKESLHGYGPLQTGPLFKQPLEVPQLMGQTQLQPLGRSLELGTEAITAPAPGLLPAHDLRNDLGSPTRTDEVVDPHDAPKDPLPPVTACHAGTGL